MKFKKITSVLGSIFMVGASIGMAFAAGYPTSIQNSDNVAIVYGTNAAQSDVTSANSLNTDLLSYIDSLNNQSVDLSDSSFIRENEVVLGTKLSDNGKFKAVITDNKLDSLIDGKVYWDDGKDSSSFNVHEEILLGNTKIITTLDDDDLKGTALTNDKDLEYRYVFDDDLNLGQIGDEDAESLKLNILGKEYEINSFDDNSMVVSIAKESVVKQGDTISYDGKTLTIEDIFDDAIQINGIIVNEGKTKKINGLEVYLQDIAYHSSDEKPSKAIVKVGSDLKQTIDDGDYYGDDESEWIWTIVNPGQKGGYIGVKYDESQVDADDDIVYEGKSYIFPEEFVTVRFDKLTDTDYQEYKFYFDEENLYDNTEGNHKLYNDAKVLILSGQNEDSFSVGGIETDKVYLKYGEELVTTITHPAIYENQTTEVLVSESWNEITEYPSWNETGYYFSTGGSPNSTDCIDEGGTFYWIGPGTSLCEFPGWNETIEHPAIYENQTTEVLVSESWNENIYNTFIEVFTNDVDKDFSDSVRPRWTMNTSADGSEIGKLVYGDTELKISANFNGTSRMVNVGELSLTLNKDGNFEYLGIEDDDAESSDVILEGKSIGTRDNDDILSHSGLLVKNVESNAEDNQVIIKVPEDKVFGEIIISNTIIPDKEIKSINTLIVKDTEVDSVKNRDLIIVGGSCINKAAAKVLGIPENTCGTDFTTATGIGTGQKIVSEYVSPYNSEKVAWLIAGFEAGDTANAVNSIIQG